MKSKTLMAIALSSTFGWSAGTFANASHEVMTPLSANETGEVIVSQNGGFGSHDSSASTRFYTSDASAMSSRDSQEFTGLSVDESLALADEGIYSDVYVVSWTPAASEDWMSYSPAIESHPIAFSDVDYVLIPSYDVVVLTPSTSFDGSSLSESEISG